MVSCVPFLITGAYYVTSALRSYGGWNIRRLLSPSLSSMQTAPSQVLRPKGDTAKINMLRPDSRSMNIGWIGTIVATTRRRPPWLFRSIASETFCRPCLPGMKSQRFSTASVATRCDRTFFSMSSQSSSL